MSEISPTGLGLRHSLSLTAGTPVLTLAGIRPAEGIRPGDRLVARNGAVAVLAAETSTLPQAEMVAIGASTLAHGQPGETLLVPADQPLLLQGARAELLYEQSPVVLPARRLVDGQLTRLLPMEDVDLVTLTFAAPAAIYASELRPVTRPEPLALAV
ncbi:iron-regulated protein frpC [Cereibacter sphaeroides]|uniref:Hint domain-containing protein n=1 Tax=Cereibacter sphaeroides TaxID=1063 RepID=UPI000F5338A0|nr:Hint domain-containing protein [Cereibacter sphaeroides]AZB55088.1 iron-regulated protein frpC [Cereibacter sphaeroides]AZB59345.1 iron-regulated protein frpC [Cereibacter sphaeroides]